MTQEELELLAAKVQDGTATPDEELALLEALNDGLEALDYDLTELGDVLEQQAIREELAGIDKG